MKSILLFLILFSSQVFGAEFLDKWTETLNHELVLNCSEEEGLCQNICNKADQCKIKQTTCRDCIGTNLFMSHIFQSFLESYSLTGRELSEAEVSDYLIKNKFVSISGSSPFNVFDDVGSNRFERQLTSLCGGMDSFPLLLGSLKKNGAIRSIDFLICHDEMGTGRVMELSHLPDVIIGAALH